MVKINSAQGQLDVDEKILKLLGENPGLKAREIASKLKVEKKQINRALYTSIKGKCFQDDKYRWYLSYDAPKTEPEEETNISKSKLSDICNYYLACIGQDDTSKINTFADSKYSLDYVELARLPQGDPKRLFKTQNVRNLFRKIKKDPYRFEMYFGYPTSLHKVVSKRSDWEGFFVEPIILFPIENGEETSRITDSFPIFNLPVLRRFTNAKHERLMQELIKLEEELNLDSEIEIPALDDLIQKLYDIRPEWPWKETINPYKLSTDPPLKDIQEEGVYNRAVFLVAERSPYTRGLETELKKLSEVAVSDYEGTSLGHWVGGNITKQIKGKKSPLLEVLPLNLEQRQSVQKSLKNSLTVITGPPGTGKSQVVSNLIINAAWRNKKILFASKNNKAVDVVETRVNNLGDRPVLLRTGSRRYRSKLAEYLMSLLSSTTSKHDKEEFLIASRRIKKLEKQFIELSKEETKLLNARNKTDGLDKSVENLRGLVSSEVFEELKSINVDRFKAIINNFRIAIKDATRDGQGFFIEMFWVFIKKSRYKKLAVEIKKVRPLGVKLQLDFPNGINKGSLRGWKKVYKTLKEYVIFAQKVQAYFTSLNSLKNTKSLEKISKEKMVLVEKMATNARDFWNNWLRLQPGRLSNKDRNLLSEYNAVLKMVVDTGSDEKLSRKIYREYKRISNKASQMLPAWAITSLSARGRIPFEAGFFDIVVFDEASQCDIASALPLLFRAKQAVIIGDPNQLRHISSLPKEQDQQLLERYKLIPNYAKWAYSYNSLFDLAAGLVPKEGLINLKDHHRSHSDIIEFSNEEFYKGNLRIATNYDNLNLLETEKNGIRWVNVEGYVKRPSSGGAVNKAEANAVVEEIIKLVNERGYMGTIGVVTPFRAHANLIGRIISKNNLLQNKLLKHNFLVDTVHKFQGDERDLMIFSPVVSRNISSNGLWFLKGNGNLFNVAITRARAMLLVVGDQKSIVKCGVEYLENFAKYTQKLKTSTAEKVSHSVEDLCAEYPTVNNPEKVSEWERLLYRALYKSNIKTIPQYQVEKYLLDLALFDGNRKLDIEVDGEHYHKNWTGELCRRDQIRNQRMYELGWDVIRFWVYEIRDDLKGCLHGINQWLGK